MCRASSVRSGLSRADPASNRQCAHERGRQEDRDVLIFNMLQQTVTTDYALDTENDDGNDGSGGDGGVDGGGKG